MDRIIRIALIVIAAISLILAIAALFSPIKLSFIRGTYGLSYEYKNQWYTLAYNSVGGYLLLLAGLVNVISSIRLFQRRYSPLRALFWALFSGVLIGSFYLAGKTVIMNWVSFLPVEIQQGIGSPYVQLREVYLTTAPQVLTSVITIIFITLVLINYFYSVGPTDSKSNNGNYSSSEPRAKSRGESRSPEKEVLDKPASREVERLEQ